MNTIKTDADPMPSSSPFQLLRAAGEQTQAEPVQTPHAPRAATVEDEDQSPATMADEFRTVVRDLKRRLRDAVIRDVGKSPRHWNASAIHYVIGGLHLLEDTAGKGLPPLERIQAFEMERLSVAEDERVCLSVATQDAFNAAHEAGLAALIGHVCIRDSGRPPSEALLGLMLAVLGLPLAGLGVRLRQHDLDLAKAKVVDAHKAVLRETCGSSDVCVSQSEIQTASEGAKAPVAQETKQETRGSSDTCVSKDEIQTVGRTAYLPSECLRARHRRMMPRALLEYADKHRLFFKLVTISGTSGTAEFVDGSTSFWRDPQPAPQVRPPVSVEVPKQTDGEPTYERLVEPVHILWPGDGPPRETIATSSVRTADAFDLPVEGVQMPASEGFTPPAATGGTQMPSPADLSPPFDPAHPPAGSYPPIDPPPTAAEEWPTLGELVGARSLWARLRKLTGHPPHHTISTEDLVRRLERHTAHANRLHEIARLTALTEDAREDQMRNRMMNSSRWVEAAPRLNALNTVLRKHLGATLEHIDLQRVDCVDAEKLDEKLAELTAALNKTTATVHSERARADALGKEVTAWRGVLAPIEEPAEVGSHFAGIRGLLGLRSDASLQNIRDELRAKLRQADTIEKQLAEAEEAAERMLGSLRRS